MTPPVFERFASSQSYKHIEFYKVDVDAVPDVAREVACGRSSCGIYVVAPNSEY